MEGKGFERGDVIEELIRFMESRKVFLRFSDYGSLPAFFTPKETAMEGLAELSGDFVRHSLEIFSFFLASPIFITSLDDEELAKIAWEERNLRFLSPKALEYYRSNRMNMETYTKVYSYANFLKELIKRPEIKEAIMGITKSFPVEISPVTRHRLWHLPERNRLALMDTFSEKIRELINILKEE